MELAWKETSKKFLLGIEFEDYFNKIGRPFEDILNMLNIKENKGDIENFFNKISTNHIDKIDFYKGVIVTLRKIIDKNIKIGIVTSKNTAKTDKILQSINIEFDIVQTPNGKLRGKPAPDHILHAMQVLGVTPKSVLYIGDMEVDYQAAKNANIDYMFAQWGYGSCHDEKIMRLKDISQILDVI